MEKPKFVYVTYIRTTPEKIWQAITEPKFARQYWGGNSNLSDWKKGAKWQHLAEDEKEVYVAGEVVESTPPRRLVLTWVDPDNTSDSSLLTLEIEPIKDMVRLRVTHADFKEGTDMADKVSQGWPLVLSSMKSFLETGASIDIWAAKEKCGS